MYKSLISFVAIMPTREECMVSRRKAELGEFSLLRAQLRFVHPSSVSRVDGHCVTAQLRPPSNVKHELTQTAYCIYIGSGHLTIGRTAVNVNFCDMVSAIPI